jgi:vitamin B12 transporter
MKVRTQLEALARRGAGRAASLRVRAIAVSAVLSGLAAPPGAADAAGAHVVEEVVVTASVTETPRRQIGTAVSVISGPEIELRGYHSLADVLRTQPGIGVSNSGGRGHSTALRIRGEEAFRTVLYIDGVKAVDPTADKVAPAFDSLLATSDLERVEVLRGPQGFMYGADAGGVVNVLTRTGAGALGARLGVEYGSFDTRKLDASLSGGGDEGDYFVSVTDLETEGFNAQTADTVLRDRDGAENTTLHAKLGWNATDALRVQLVARDIDAAVRFDGCGFPTTTHDCEATTEQTTYRLSVDYRADRVSHVVAYSESDILRHSLAEGAIAFTADGNLSRFEYIGSFRPSDALTLAYGVDLQTEKVVGAPTRERDQKGYYFEYQGRLGEAFFVSAGARYDDNDDFGTHTSARLSAAYVQALGDGSTLKVTARR